MTITTIMGSCDNKMAVLPVKGIGLPHLFLNRRSVYLLDYLLRCHKLYALLLKSWFIECCCIIALSVYFHIRSYRLIDCFMPCVEHVFSFLSEREGETSSLWPSTCLMEGFMFCATLLCGNSNYPSCPDKIIKKQKPHSLNWLYNVQV